MTPLRIVALLLVAASFVATALAYPSLPPTIAVHWGFSGAPDGFADRSEAWLLPGLGAGVVALLAGLPRILPLRGHVEASRRAYDVFVAALAAFLLAVNAWTLAWNLGRPVPANVVMPLALGALFVVLGGVMANTRRNWILGVRTPWTLSDDRVWDRTHRVAAWVWAACGVVTMLGALWQDRAMWFVLGATVAASVVSIVASYVIWVRLGRPETGRGA